MFITRRRLDIVISTVGLGLAALLIVVGFVLEDESSFASDYVKDQLGEQKISFANADKLTDEEKTWKPGSQCLVDYAGKPLETGKMSECYANYYINLHLENAAESAGYPGETYASIGGVQTQLRNQVNDLKAKNDTAAAAEAQKKLDAVNSLRDTQFRGETLRGLLLTTYGFSIFGDKAGLVATICYAMAGILGVLAIAGYAHAFFVRRSAEAGPADAGKP